MFWSYVCFGWEPRCLATQTKCQMIDEFNLNNSINIFFQQVSQHQWWALFVMMKGLNFCSLTLSSCFVLFLNYATPFPAFHKFGELECSNRAKRTVCISTIYYYLSHFLFLDRVKPGWPCHFSIFMPRTKVIMYLLLNLLLLL